MEGIALALDVKGGPMFITDLAGAVYSANLDGSNKKTLLGDRYRAECRARAEALRRSGLAGAQEIGPRS
jgi:hypothetical protein